MPVQPTAFGLPQIIEVVALTTDRPVEVSMKLN
jgi:hypothetical protein